MLITIPIGPLLIFEEALNPSIGSVLSARSSSISPIGFITLGNIHYILNSIPYANILFDLGAKAIDIIEKLIRNTTEKDNVIVAMSD